MSIAESRRDRARRKASFYKNLAIGTAFVLLGNLATYPALLQGCLVLLAIAILAINTPLIAAILTGFARADRLHKSKVQQQLSVLAASVGVYVAMFVLGGLV